MGSVLSERRRKSRRRGISRVCNIRDGKIHGKASDRCAGRGGCLLGGGISLRGDENVLELDGHCERAKCHRTIT